MATKILKNSDRKPFQVLMELVPVLATDGQQLSIYLQFIIPECLYMLERNDVRLVNPEKAIRCQALFQLTHC